MTVVYPIGNLLGWQLDTMPRERTIIQIPKALAADLDQLAGPGHRSEFAAQVLMREVRRQKLLKFLVENRGKPIWRDEDHPEFADGTDAWVKSVREGWETRLNRETGGEDTQ